MSAAVARGPTALVDSSMAERSFVGSPTVGASRSVAVPILLRSVWRRRADRV